MSILYTEHRCLVLGIFYFHPFPFAGTHRTLPPLRLYARGTHRTLPTPMPLRFRDAPHTPFFTPLRARDAPHTSLSYTPTPAAHTAHSHLYALTLSERTAHSHLYAFTRAPTRIRYIYYPHSTLGCRTVRPQCGHPKGRKRHASPPSPPRADQPQSTDSC